MSVPSPNSAAESVRAQRESLMGQASQEAADAVRAQREAKKNAKAAKKAAAVGKVPATPPPAEHNKDEARTGTNAFTDPCGDASLSGTSAQPSPDVAPQKAATKPKAKRTGDAPALPSSRVTDVAVPPTQLGTCVAELGLLLQAHRIVGANARCIAVLNAIIETLAAAALDETTQRLSFREAQGICTLIKVNCEFLNSCRPFTPGMTWITESLKTRLMTSAEHTTQNSPLTVAVEHAQRLLAEVTESIAAVVEEGKNCISDGDVILTYGRSFAVEQVLLLSRAGCNFTVIVVDAAPLYEGRAMQWRLQQSGISTSYVLLTSVCATMMKCTKVFIGAASVLQNGQVVARAGTAVVCLVAKHFRKPLLCFCETYKFTDRVWSSRDRNPNQLASYDVTPRDSVDIIVSDMGLLHPTAVAAAIRDRNEKEYKAVEL